MRGMVLRGDSIVVILRVVTILFPGTLRVSHSSFGPLWFISTDVFNRKKKKINTPKWWIIQ